jgi:DNA-binding transcriptional MerR regulator
MTSSITETTYSSREVCEITGLTYRQLDWWIRTGKIELSWDGTPGSGHPRRWSEHEVRRLQAMLAAYDEAQEVIEALRNGDLWARSA